MDYIIPYYLICPADSTRQEATDFQSLGPLNVSYQIRSGMRVNQSNPSELLARCPIHGHALFCDGKVVSGK